MAVMAVMAVVVAAVVVIVLIAVVIVIVIVVAVVVIWNVLRSGKCGNLFLRVGAGRLKKREMRGKKGHQASGRGSEENDTIRWRGSYDVKRLRGASRMSIGSNR